MKLAKNLLAPVAQGARLEVFPGSQVERIRDELGAAIGDPAAPWPVIEGCLVVLFTARSGSTFLTRELEFAFKLGRMGESLNPPRIIERGARAIVSGRQDPWFGFKAGVPGVAAAELCGFVEAYLDRTVFLRLVRGDIVAQAVSMVRAAQTGRWHQHNQPIATPTYDGAAIAKAVRKIATSVDELPRYMEACRRPHRTVIYEEFTGDDFTPAFTACDGLGVPRRRADDAVAHRPVERMGDAINEEWRAKFGDDLDAKTDRRIDRYLAAIGR